MRHLRLTEYRTEPAVPLDLEERDLLRRAVQIAPTAGVGGCYDLTPGSKVGVIQGGSLTAEIRPKIPIGRVIFLISYALDPSAWRDTGFDFDSQDSLLEAMIPGFVLQVRRAVRRGLLHGYRVEEAAEAGVRGRIRFDDQLRFRFGLGPPLELRFDEYTEDIDANRLLKAAIRRLGRLPIRSPEARRSLREFDQALARVADVEYDPRNLPDVSWNRLNMHYRAPTELAKLILRCSSFELGQGKVRSATFLVDMNRVFENFVVVALREALGLTEREFPQGSSTARLDHASRVVIKPDISWWRYGTCVFVGDVKYKELDDDEIKHPDLYQLLAYVVANDLPGGLLIYAAGKIEPAVHEVLHVNRRLEIATIDLEGAPDMILAQVREVAVRVRGLRSMAPITAST